MPQVEVAKPRDNRAIIIGISSLALLVVLVAVVIYVVEQQAAAQLALAKYNDTMSQAKGLDNTGKYSQEQQVFTQYLKTNPPNKYRYVPLIQLADLAYGNGSFATAITDYKEAEAANGKIEELDAAGIAASAQAEGDKLTAIKYYKLAIQYTQIQPGVSNSISDYQTDIRFLGGTP